MKLRTALASAGAIFLLMVTPVVARTWQSGGQLPQLNIYTWSSYISPRVIHGFEEHQPDSGGPIGRRYPGRHYLQ